MPLFAVARIDETTVLLHLNTPARSRPGVAFPLNVVAYSLTCMADCSARWEELAWAPGSCAFSRDQAPEHQHISQAAPSIAMNPPSD